MISQLKAIEIAINAVEKMRREKYAAGHAAYMQGVRPDEIKDKKIKGTPFAWVLTDHEKYIECSQVIRQLEDLQEILTDSGVTIDEYGDLPLFEVMQ